MEEPSSIVIADTSVLINFLAVDCMALIKRHSCRFFITDHVHREVTSYYEEQRVRLEIALAQGILEEIVVDDPEEVGLFAQLTQLERFGYGECSCLAVALHRDYALAIDDKKAIKQAYLLRPGLRIITTEDLMVSMITSGLLTVEEADAIKEAWASAHRFRLNIQSFLDLL